MALTSTPLGTPAAPPPMSVPDRVPFRRSWLAAYQHMLLLYRRTWRGSIFGTFLTPVMFLVAMGVGLGSFVDQSGSDALGGVPYLSFLAPGLLVATVMQTGAFEATFPILGGFRWTGRYHAMHATPLTPDAIALGQIGWTATRITLVGSIFFFVMILFGAVHSPWGVLAIPVATLTGLSFSGPIGAFMSTQRNANTFSSIWRPCGWAQSRGTGTWAHCSRGPQCCQSMPGAAAAPADCTSAATMPSTSSRTDVGSRLRRRRYIG